MLVEFSMYRCAYLTVSILALRPASITPWAPAPSGTPAPPWAPASSRASAPAGPTWTPAPAPWAFATSSSRTSAGTSRTLSGRPSGALRTSSHGALAAVSSGAWAP